MKTLTRLSLALLAGAALTAPAFAGDDITKTYDFDGFDTLEINGIYELDVQVGEDFSIEISGEEDEMSRVKVSVKKGTLVLDRKDGEKKKNRWWGNGDDDNDGVDVRITMPYLAEIDVTGIVDGEVRGIEADRFEVELSGIGELELYGTCSELEIDLSGIGDLDAKGLECEDVEADMSGMGDLTVFASQSVDADINGMGEIDVYGDPEDVSKSDGWFSDVNVR